METRSISQKYWEKSHFDTGIPEYPRLISTLDKATYDRLVTLEAKIEVMENILKWSSLDAHSRLVLKKLVANRKAELAELVKELKIY